MLGWRRGTRTVDRQVVMVDFKEVFEVRYEHIGSYLLKQALAGKLKSNPVLRDFADFQGMVHLGASTEALKGVAIVEFCDVQTMLFIFITLLSGSVHRKFK